MLHTGYQVNKATGNPVNGLVTGIGGKLVFRLGDHFRLGTEGYVSSHNYPSNEGQYRLGWGGLLAEYQFTDTRLIPVAGLAFGGGSVHDLFLLGGNFTDQEADPALYRVFSTFLLVPELSLEYRLTDHINLALKFDYIIYPGSAYSDFLASGPRMYIGVLFAR